MHNMPWRAWHSVGEESCFSRSPVECCEDMRNVSFQCRLYAVVQPVVACPADLAAHERYTVVADSQGGLVIVEEDGLNLTQVAVVPTPGSARAVAVDGAVAVGGDAGRGHRERDDPVPRHG